MITVDFDKLPEFVKHVIVGAQTEDVNKIIDARAYPTAPENIQLIVNGVDISYAITDMAKGIAERLDRYISERATELMSAKYAELINVIMDAQAKFEEMADDIHQS